MGGGGWQQQQQRSRLQFASALLLYGGLVSARTSGFEHAQFTCARLLQLLAARIEELQRQSESVQKEAREKTLSLATEHQRAMGQAQRQQEGQVAQLRTELEVGGSWTLARASVMASLNTG